MRTILITGAAGQIGSELTIALGRRFANADVLATDIRPPERAEFPENVRFELLDVMEVEQLERQVVAHKVSTLYHMAAMLSATAERLPAEAWALNTTSLLNVLNLARAGVLESVFWPSSIAVFGPHTPKVDTPQYSITDPTTVYGIGKLAGERWCAYYAERFQVDVRSLRYPGIISWKTQPGGGATDYAVEIFHKALACHRYDCFIGEEVALPMLYMPDAIEATLRLMEAPAENLSPGLSYNLGGLSFSPSELGAAIKVVLPDFVLRCKPDFRDAIARSWPSRIDDTAARRDWSWTPRYELADIVRDMLANLSRSSV